MTLHKIPRSLLLLLLGSFIISSCSQMSMVDRINSYEAEYTNIVSSKKQVRFIGMVHIGQPQFYENVKRLVRESEKEGYTLFYENVSFENMSDSSLRKVRRIVGFIPTESGYQSNLKGLVNKGYVVQHNDSFMNLTGTKDVNADIDGNELVREYEKRFGTIELSEKDKLSPLSEKAEKLLPKENVEAVILEYRNEKLASLVNGHPSTKIVIIYGAKHLNGLIKELQKIDPSYVVLSKGTTENDPAYLQVLTGDSIRKSTTDYIIEDGYIDQVNQYMNARVTLKDYYEIFNLNSGGKQYYINPNSGTSIRLTGDYKSISVWWTYTPDVFQSNNDEIQKGRSNGFNFGLGIIRKHWFHQFNFRYIEGFYLDNTKDFNPIWKTGDPYIQNLNMRYAALEGQTGYKFNPKFSLRSFTSKTERQLKSVGSLVASTNYRFYQTSDEQSPRFDSIANTSNYELGFNIGYFYNFIFFKNYYLSLGLSPGIGAVYATVEQDKTGTLESSNHTTGLIRASAHAGLGYNGERFMIGVLSNFTAGGFFKDNIPVYNTNFRNLYEFHIGYRLEVNKKLRSNRML